MIWHIFKKDCRLLWPFAVVVALLEAANSYLRTTLGVFLEPTSLLVFASILPVVEVLGLAVLVALAVHQDPLPGTTQDWLVRPISRVDLLLSKLLFIVVVAHGPLFAIDFIEALATGMSPTISFHAALSEGFSRFWLISLSAAVLASVVRNIVEFVVGLFILTVVFVLLNISIYTLGFSPPPTSGAGISWVGWSLVTVSVVLMAAIVLLRQYCVRATVSSRCLIAFTMIVVMGCLFIPWQTGFAIQRWFASQPGGAGSVTLAYEPRMGKFQRPRGAASDAAHRSESTDAIYLPVRIVGLSENSALLVDRADIRLKDSNGMELYRGTSYSNLYEHAQAANVRLAVFQNRSNGAEIDSHQTIFIPAKTYAALKARTVRMEVDYSLTLLHSYGVGTLSTLDGELRTEGTQCKTRLATDRIQLACVTAGKRPSCSRISVQYESSIWNYSEARCDPDYVPYHFLFTRSGIRNGPHAYLPYIDPVASAKVRGKLDSRISVNEGPGKLTIESYEAQDHFTRQLVIPKMRLADWEAEIAPAKEPGLVVVSPSL